MSGHSKWAGIKHKKAKNDAERGKVFTKLIRELTVAARESGPDPSGNFRLRLAMDKARDNNMPTDTIEKAIKRGAGTAEGTHYEEVSYEGYGPAGVAVMVEVLTDNRNRAAGEIRSLFSRSGGSMAGEGAVSWLFQRRGQVVADVGAKDRDAVELVAIDAGAEDIAEHDGRLVIVTPPDRLAAVRDAIAAAGARVSEAELSLVPINEVRVSAADAPRVLKLLEQLEEHDDVQQVYANADLPDEVLAAIG
jgi:YebC/PmpR family DNA-binding regulatory protein